MGETRGRSGRKDSLIRSAPCVRKLREKLSRSGTHTYVQTHYGVGYRFEPLPIDR